MKFTRLIFLLAFACQALGQNISSVTNLFALTNRPPSTINTTVIMQGRVTPGDGKGGIYVWSAASSAVIDWTNVLGSSLTGSGRWLLSLPSPTPVTSDSSKVDRVGGTATGLDSTDTDLLGTTRVNGVNLETALASKLDGSGTAGQLAVFSAPGTVGASGFSTNSVKNVGRVVLTSAELVAQSPAELAATTGGTLSFVTTTGDLTPGTGVRYWRWNSASTATTNAASSGGPIAYPYNAGTGRWESVATASLPAVSYRLMTIPALYPDAADGSPNATDPAPNIQTYWTAASTAYDAVLGPVVVDHPSGSYTGGELVFKSNVIYNSDGYWHFKKRFDTTNGVQRSTATTSRIGFANLDPVDGCFLSWGSAGGTNQYYADADKWYAGQAANITFTGKGKFIFDQNGKSLGQPNVRILDAENWVVLGGCVESWITPISTNGPGNSYGFGIGARGLYWERPIVRGGRETWQDGFHGFSGRDWLVLGGYIESGDDSLVFEAEAAGGSTLPPDEWLEDIQVIGWNANTLRARAVIIMGGVNTVTVPYANGGLRCRNIRVSGVTGKCAQLRQHAIGLASYQEAYSIWDYQITNPGTNYTDGYYTNLAVGNVGGGSGAKCTVKVVGGKITRAVMFKAGGTNYIGDSYKQDQAVTLTGIPGGSNAVVTGIVFGKPNNLVVNCAVTDFSLTMGNAAHDGTDPYQVKIAGATGCQIGPGDFLLTENSGTPIHRPYMINSASNCILTGIKFAPTTRGGAISTTDYPKSYVTGLVIEKCELGPHANGGQGILKVNGYDIGTVTYRNNTIWVGNNMAAFYFPDIEGGITNWITRFEVIDNHIMAVSGASNTRAMDIVPSGGSGTLFGMLRLTGNTLIGMTTADSAAVAQASASAFWIDGNEGGWRSKLGSVVTQTSGTSQVSVSVGTFTGLIDNTTASLPCVRVVPLGNPGSNWWIEPSTTGAFLIKTASAVGSDLNWAVSIDTSRKPLTGY